MRLRYLAENLASTADPECLFFVGRADSGCEVKLIYLKPDFVYCCDDAK